ncbi:MAG: hypothetical protein VR64_20125 [Desulfatitalea sp. BRH_c12]|jgi:hypothetical protein|nr:MAG: hypothetical protein VR64_20125 [Desulfatitalea sp. BRH_c12]
MKKRGMRCLALILVGLLALPPLSFAQNAKLTNIIVTNTQDDLLLYLSVKNAFPPEIEETIKSGVPAAFSFYINLYQVRSFWPDKEVVELDVTHLIKYDNLKKEYMVTRSWEGERPTAVESFEEAQMLMTEIDAMAIASLQLLEKNKQYQIRAKAKLSKLTLPFYLHYVLFFVSLWDFETDWYTIDFIY